MSNGARLTKGQAAPLFSSPTVYGGEFDLERLQGNLVWLIFYRYPGCPFCNLHIRALGRRLDLLKQAGVTTVAVFDSPRSAFEGSLIEKAGLKDLVMIADDTHEIFDLYGLERKLSGFLSLRSLYELASSVLKGGRQGAITGNVTQMPGSFLIDQAGDLQYCHYGRSIGDHPQWTKIEAFIEEFKIVTWNSYQESTS